MAKIVIVDDEPDLRALIRMSLEINNHEFFEACDAQTGLQLIESVDPDLILLDVMMPDMSGAEVAEELLLDDRTKNIPIVFITALVKKNEVKNDSGTVGGREFMAKPVSKEELINRIETTLNLNQG